MHRVNQHLLTVQAGRVIRMDTQKYAAVVLKPQENNDTQRQQHPRCCILSNNLNKKYMHKFTVQY